MDQDSWGYLLTHTIGGWFVLLLAGMAALAVVLWLLLKVLQGAVALSRAFARGWRSAAPPPDN